MSLAAALALLLTPLAAASERDYAAGAWTILPPGENGSLMFDRNTTDQAKLYDALTSLRGNVSAAGYVDMDLPQPARPHCPRAVLVPPLRGGVLATCREARWGALDLAAAKLEASQGPAPSSSCADATKERIRFTSGVLQDTMRRTNRPTFQQIMSFSSHRLR